MLFIPLLLLCVIGCSNENIPFKTEFKINEAATIDHFDIKLINAKKIENEMLEIVFEIKNNSKNTITISEDKNFVLYDINKVQVPNTYHNSNNVIKKGQTITYTLNYEISKEIYEIYFYSGIVENNIKFTFQNSDLIN